MYMLLLYTTPRQHNDDGGTAMRIYTEGKEKELVSVTCNGCKKALQVDNGYLQEECIHFRHDFGFFGTDDGVTHEFDLCEDCYRKMIEQLLIPVTSFERRELL